MLQVTLFVLWASRIPILVSDIEIGILEAHSTNRVSAYVTNHDYVTDMLGFELVPAWKQDRTQTVSKLRTMTTHGSR